MEIIRTYELIKRYGKTVAVDNISVCVEQGEIYGFTGLNGAGKTTLIRILLGMIKPDAGTVTLFGKKLTANFDHWNDIGYLVETPPKQIYLCTEDLEMYFLRTIKEHKT